MRKHPFEKHVADAREREKSLGPLYRMLKRAFPQYRTQYGQLSVIELAKVLKIRDQTIYLWFQNEKISPKAVVDLVAMSNGTLTYSDFEKFVFKK